MKSIGVFLGVDSNAGGMFQYTQSILVRKRVDELVPDLRQRFPKADLVRSEKECKPLVARVVKFIAEPVGQ